MIDLTQDTLGPEAEVRIPINRWEVWFMTPLGVFEHKQEAILSMKQIDFPIHIIRPVPVAIGEDGSYEVAV